MADKSYRTLRYPAHLLTVGDLTNLLSTLDERVNRLSDIKPQRGGKHLRYTGELDIAGLRTLLNQFSSGAKLYPDLLIHVSSLAKPVPAGVLRRMVGRIRFRHFGILLLVIYLLVIHVYAALYISSVARSGMSSESNVTNDLSRGDTQKNEAFTPPVAAKTIEDTYRISYGSESAEKVLHLFIDPQCPVCRKMEPEISALVKTGWRVIKYPVAILGDKSAADVQTIFCSPAPGAVLNEIMAGKEVAPVTCDRARYASAVNTDFFLGLGLDRVPVMAYGTTGKFIVGFHTSSEIESWAKTLKQ